MRKTDRGFRFRQHAFRDEHLPCNNALPSTSWNGKVAPVSPVQSPSGMLFRARMAGIALGMTILGTAIAAFAAPSSFAQEGSVIKESFVRVFVPPDKFVPTIKSYMAATGGRCSMHFPFPERKLELAAVASPHAAFLIIAGEPDALERFRSTFVTFHVTNLDEAITAATKGGATLLQKRTEVPTGLQARVKMPDGLTIELVEHNEAARRFYHCRDLPLD